MNLEVIERENRKEYERGHAMLQQFYHKQPNNFNLPVMIRALIAIERNDLVEMIDPKHQWNS